MVMVTPADDEIELVAKNRSGKRKFILLTVIPVMILGIAAVLLLTVGDGDGAADKGASPSRALPLSDITEGWFDRSSPVWNGTWVSDTEILMKDEHENLILHDVEAAKSTVVLENNPDKLLSTGIQYELSADKRYIMIATTYTRLYRYSFIARYQIYDIQKRVTFPLANATVNTSEPLEVQLVMWAPKGNGFAYVYLNNVYYRPSAESTIEYQLTTDGIRNYVYNGVPDWVYEEEVLASNSAMWFSPDGQKLAYASFNDTSVPVMTVPFYGAASSPKFQYPLPVNIRYPKAGRSNPTVNLNLVTLPKASENPTAQPSLTLLPRPDDFSEHNSILSIVTWRDASNIIAIWFNRVQNSSRIMLCKAEGKQECFVLYKLDESNGWIEIDKAPVFSEDGKHMLLVLPHLDPSGSDKYPHITRLSTEVPKESIPLTEGAFSVNHIHGWDWAEHKIYFTATLPQHPEQLHFFVTSDGLDASSKSPECLSCKLKLSSGSPCTYVVVSGSPGNSHFALTCVGPGPAEAFIYNKQGRLFSSWESNEVVRRKLQEIKLPTVKYLRAPIERTDMKAYVKLLLPPNLDTSGKTKYPLLVHVYGGPKSNLAVDTFKMDWNHYLAINKSVIIAHIDGRNSGLKGQKMLFAGYRRLGTVEIFDQINVTRYLQNTLPYIDKSRTAIWGWSYGGYATAMALAQDVNNVFQCGVSVAPVTDWVYYDTIYTERYMGLPIIEDNVMGYIGASLNNKVENLRNKKYLLIHGTYDDNVHFQQSMMLSRQLELKDIMFQQMSYPDEEHGLVGVRPHFYHTLTRFISDCFHLDQ
ncbi:venom dipeptidyl peptidase 4 isoform X2 [Bemisia tabaci]|uniref:venom dipeptidyl peptidase 4 isoform X2 n=1 Tax=Bemisia tabaci TaxID=7038 RepID=UPI0008F9BF78|nr:PREDICTED: venom dipeptidyl peptidase 4 isoform X3 [Bemisia tabaci]